jgi:chromate transporter
MDMDIVIAFAQLFGTFLLIGAFTFGGGYAMLSLIQGYVVTAHGWISESTFTNIVAISQMTPGPIGINCATYVGYEVAKSYGASWFVGVLGSFTATLALMLPSFVIVLMMVKFYEKFKNSRTFEEVMTWVRPTVTGLIGAAAIILVVNTSWDGIPLLSKVHMEVIHENFIDWKSWALFAAAMIASLFFKVGPITIIIAGGVLGLLLY